VHQVIIIGGGIAGLVTAIDLARSGVDVVVFEKKEYPFHKVCGEYISNEVLPYLVSLNLNVKDLRPATISKLYVSSPAGRELKMELDQGGFGISRFSFDHFLYLHAISSGAKVYQGKTVENVEFLDGRFIVSLKAGEQFESKVVTGAYGKRAKLDNQLKRIFISKRSPWIGVKYHIKTDHPADTIALHNFKDGYCGISAVENGIYCLCYLTSRENLRKHRSIPEMEKEVLNKNPFLKEIFMNSEFLWKAPEVINEISFAKKSAVEDHILMTGDTAGMISPLCGNGMAMAIHSAKIVSQSISSFLAGKISREELEAWYSKEWNQKFSARLKAGRLIQGMFGSEIVSEIMISTLKQLPSVSRWIVRRTHGKPF
jgi:menaquinone-9 beta-reductase